MLRLLISGAPSGLALESLNREQREPLNLSWPAQRGPHLIRVNRGHVYKADGEVFWGFMSHYPIDVGGGTAESLWPSVLRVNDKRRLGRHLCVGSLEVRSLINQQNELFCGNMFSTQLVQYPQCYVSPFSVSYRPTCICVWRATTSYHKATVVTFKHKNYLVRLR